MSAPGRSKGEQRKAKPEALPTGKAAALDKPARRTQAERSGATRARILDAALVLLGEKGYAGLRTLDVAQAAGVSKGAQTHHFPSKDDLVVAVVEHVFQRASEQARDRARRVRRGITPDEAIKALIADAQEFFFSELFLVALDLAIQGRLREAARNPMTELSAATRLPVEAQWRAALVESGVPGDVADDLLWLTLSIVRGLAVRRLWQHDAPRFNRLFRLWREMAVGYLANLHARPAKAAAAKRVHGR
ncbi:MAG: TetR/AcrR family transcriptional regulator [Rubrivivax sp.]|nr:TetR/AcrR family transcriptional regulator [Rubrivivax sp.]